ncbi:DUF4232 domain-containing protein [Streptomyces sp. NPDC051776]|uniref:DUF4232 domain-containing protein n=1 Tax=Streptomyces sp. NPDC051776 TaxID=3155414 RepID=UPI00343565C3
MRRRAGTITAGAVLLAAVSLTACGPEEGKAAYNGESSSSSDAASSEGKTGGQGKENGSGNNTGSGKEDGSGGGSGDSEVAESCTTKNTELGFVVVQHSNDRQDAKAELRVTNTGSRTCTIVGVTVFMAKDITGKPATVEIDNTGTGVDAVDVAPGKSAVATVKYIDHNNDGTGSEECALEAHEVQVALPLDDTRSVEVKRAGEGGEMASFMACAPDKVKLGAFSN